MQNKETRKDLAVRVMNDCMAMRNLNQAEIADRLGVSRATVSNWLKTPQGMTTKNVERVLFVFHKEAASIMENGSVNAPTIDDFRKKLVGKIMDAGFDTETQRRIINIILED